MLEKLYYTIFGNPDEKKVKKYEKIVEEILKKEQDYEKYTIEGIQNKTQELKKRFEGLDFTLEQDSIKIKQLLDDTKVEAFALVKQACKLINGQEFEVKSGKKIVWNMIPYDVQLIGGLCIHDGNISEMKTGEGKTLVATLPAYLNALAGNSVHIVTVNDYLAKRDAEEMGILYETLGLKVGVVTHNQSREEKKQAYESDIVYATNNELGFDYLRDNMVVKKKDKSQGKLFFAIVDEVDSILIDEARTPLIISTPGGEATDKYIKFSSIAKKLAEGTDYKIDEKQKTAVLTEKGIEKIEGLLGVDNIYLSANYNDLHHIENALKARAVYKKDKDYLVNNGEVMIIDEFTGRVLSGRRYSEGLHQAIEAKEGVEIKQESRTLASITFQNYFRLYWKLAGMTGTAKTEEEEFYKVYSLDTISIPTNKPIARIDKSDLLFKNEKGKFDYLVKLIKEANEKGQPVLAGTVSVDKSEYLSGLLKKEGIIHKVLNAKYHEKEAEIISKAGEKGAVTIATNMAGRGTDIKLGKGVVDLGGLMIIGTEKHETRRIDNQLRGRSGRQGDPGLTQFLVSPNDDIMRIFGGDKLFSVFNSPIFASLPDDEPLTESKMLTSRVTGVQKQVEGHHFDARKHVLEYDDVINKHREVIYGRRNKILDSENIDEDIKSMVREQVISLVESTLIPTDPTLWELNTLVSKVNDFFDKEILEDEREIEKFIDKKEISNYIFKVCGGELEKTRQKIGDDERYFDLERRIVLQSIDELWMRHIDDMSRLRESVAFEGYAQRNPLIVYKERAFEKFANLISEIGYKVTKAMFNLDKGSKVEEVDISKVNHIFNEEEIEGMLSNYSGEKGSLKSSKSTIKVKGNPLFAKPTTQRVQVKQTPAQKTEKKKIRV